MDQQGGLSETRHFHGWYILASSFVILFFSAGARYSFGVIFKPMIGEFGWDRGSISSAFFLNMTFYALSLAAAGKLYDRYGPRWVIVVSTLFLSGGYVLVAFVNTLWQFLVCYGIITAIGLGGTSVTLMAAITSKWFERWRGAAVSLALSGNSIGQFVLIPLFTDYVTRYGWRISYIAIGCIMLVVNITLALFVIKGDPGDLGQRPFGRESKDSRTHDVSMTDSPDLGFGQAMRTPSFWLFLVVMFICGSGDFLVTTHLIPLVTDYGFSPAVGGRMLAWLGLMSLAGIIVAGPASDLIGNKIPIALTFLLRFFLFIFIVKYQSLASFYAFAVAFGFTLLITAPLNATLMGRLYGYTHLGIITGFITTVHQLGGGFWAYVGGVIYDQTASYRLAFILSAIMALIAVLSTIFILEKKHQVVPHKSRAA